MAGARRGAQRALVLGLRMAVPGRVRARRGPHRLAGELPDHDGLAGGDAGVRGGRGGGHGAHRLGSAPRRPRPAHGRGPHDRVPRSCSTASTWRRWWSAVSGSTSGLFPGPAPFAITVIPAIFGGVVIGLFLPPGLPPRRPRAAGRPLDERRALARPGGAQAGGALGPGRPSACGRRSGSCGRNDPALIGTIAWWALNIADALGLLSRLRSAPPQAVIVMAYFVGMLGNLCPCREGSAGWTEG